MRNQGLIMKTSKFQYKTMWKRDGNELTCLSQRKRCRNTKRCLHFHLTHFLSKPSCGNATEFWTIRFLQRFRIAETPYFTLWHILYNLPSTLRNSVRHNDWSRHYFPLKWGGCLGLGCRIFLPVSDLTNSSLTSSANIAGRSLSRIIQLSCWETWRPGLIAIASLAVARRKPTKLCLFKLTT